MGKEKKKKEKEIEKTKKYREQQTARKKTQSSGWLLHAIEVARR